MAAISKQELENASPDARTLEGFALGGVGVPNINRAGNDVKNLATIRQEALDVAADSANRQTYITRAQMLDDISQPVKTPARVETGPGAGDYVMTASGWEFSDVQPATASRLNQVARDAEYAASAPIWSKGTSSTDVRYSEATRTLSWTGPIVAVLSDGGNSQILLPAHSISLPNTDYTYVWLDLRDVPVSGNAPLTAIKVGVRGSGESGYAALPHQRAIFYRERANSYSSVGGFFDLGDKRGAQYASSAQVWSKGSVNTVVRYSESTRTLSWTGPIVAALNGGSSNQILLQAHSVVIPNVNYTYVWIDVRDVPSTGNTPLTAVKVGVRGPGENDYASLPYQRVIFFRERDNEYTSVGGFFGLGNPREALYATGKVWMRGTATGGGITSVTFDQTTGVLVSNGNMISPGDLPGKRLLVPAFSITVPPSPNYQVVWVDMTMLNGGEAPVEAIKVGSYGNSENSFNSRSTQLPIFFQERSGVYGPVGSFPAPKSGGSAPAVITNRSLITVRKTASDVSIIVPGTKNNSIEHTQKRTVLPLVDPSISAHSDQWRRGAAYELDKEGNRLWSGSPFVSDGEWDISISLVGAGDSFGGYHGDEIQQRSAFIIDGRAYDQDAIFEHQCAKYSFVQKSTLYEYNSEIEAMIRWLQITYTPEKINVKQEFLALRDMLVRNMYLAMIPIRRNINGASGALVTDHLIRLPDYEIEDVSTWGSDRSNIVTPALDGYGIEIFGETSGISAGIHLNKMPGFDGASMFANITTSIYNKVYVNAKNVDNEGGPRLALVAGQKFSIDVDYRITTSNQS